MLKHYARFLYPGSFMSEEKVEEIKERNPDKVEVPKLSGLRCFAFYFFDREEVENNGEILRGKEKNQSNKYYVGGKLYTLNKLKREKPGLTTLISNMECNKWEKMILCRTGNWQPFEKGDVLLEEQG